MLSRKDNFGDFETLASLIDAAYRRVTSPNFINIKDCPNCKRPVVNLLRQELGDRKLLTYYGQVAIGSNAQNRLGVLFDTGSCEFWVIDEHCQSSICRRHTRYKTSPSFYQRRSPSGKPIELRIEYLSGSIVGFDGLETVVLGKSLRVPHTHVGFATNLNIPLLQDLRWDGILGLGFPNKEMLDRGSVPFLQHLSDTQLLTDQGLSNSFAYYIGAKGGSVTFGYHNPSLMKNPSAPIMWAPVDPHNTYWTIKVLRIIKHSAAPQWVKSTQNFPDGGVKSIVDTGTYLIYAPVDTIRNFLPELRIRSCADVSRLPTITFEILSSDENRPVFLTMEPKDYVLEFEGSSGPTCVMGIVPDEASDQDQLDGFTFGQAFLRKYYTIFDWGSRKIGFAEAK